MGKNVLEMIEALNDESTIKDFKGVLQAREEELGASIEKKDAEVKALNEKIIALMEASAKEPDESVSMTDDQKHSEFFRASIKGDVETVQKYKGFMTKGADWDQSTWNIGEKAALGTVLRGDATTGSYLVPEAYEAEVFRMAAQASQMMGKVRSIPMAVRKIYWPAENATPDITWVTDETTAKTETSPTFAQIPLECETAAAWLTVTEELVEDSLINLADFFRMQFSEVWAQEFDKQVLYSNTAPFVGMAYNTSCNIRNMAAGKTSFADVTVEDLIDMEDDISAAKGENALNGAYFIMNRYIFNILRRQKDDTGEFVYQKPAEGQPGTIWNYPYILSDVMPGSSSDAVDTPFLILGNPKYWLHGNRVGMQFLTYDRTVRNIDYDQIFYRFRIRQAFAGAIPSAFAVLETAAA